MSNKNPIIFVMVGIPGAGKSTTIDKLNANCFVSSDWHIERIAKAQGKTYNEVFSQVAQDAAKELDKDVDLMFSMGLSFVWDQTNISKEKRQAILNRTPKNYIKVAVFINTPLDIAIERNFNRSRTIPEHVIRSMSTQLTHPTLEEGFDHILEFDPYGRINGYSCFNEEGKEMHFINRGQHTISN